MVVPPKHPEMIIFSRKNPWLLGTTIFGNPHIWVFFDDGKRLVRHRLWYAFWMVAAEIEILKWVAKSGYCRHFRWVSWNSRGFMIHLVSSYSLHLCTHSWRGPQSVMAWEVNGLKKCLLMNYPHLWPRTCPTIIYYVKVGNSSKFTPWHLGHL